MNPFQGLKIAHYLEYHKESGLRGQIILNGLHESVDNGLIGYSDPKFEFYSPLNEDNQQKIHDYIDSQGFIDREIVLRYVSKILVYDS